MLMVRSFAVEVRGLQPVRAGRARLGTDSRDRGGWRHPGGRAGRRAAGTRRASARSRGRGPRTSSTERMTEPASGRAGSGPSSTTRSDRASASSTSWVTSRIVAGSTECTSMSRSCMVRRVRASSAPNGSSSSSTPGPRDRARAREARCAIPPETWRGRNAEAASSCTRRSSSCTRARPVAPGVSSGKSELNVALDRAPRKQSRLLERHRGALVDRRDRGAVDQHGSGIRGIESADQAKQRRLAAAGGAEQRDDLAGPDLEVDVAQHRTDLAAGLGERPADPAQAHAEGRGAQGRSPHDG